MTSPQFFDRERVGKENWDFMDRLIKEGVEITYDDDSDILFITVGGQPYEAITEHVLDTFYLRIDPDSLKIVGITILEFMSNVLANNKIIRLAFGEDFNNLRTKGGTTRIEGENAQKLAPLLSLARSA